jgi:hypothetical protein
MPRFPSRVLAVRHHNEHIHVQTFLHEKKAR